jgi:hypothetical protein
MADWSKVKATLLEKLNKAQNTTIEPGDETRYNETSNMTNMAVNALGLPQSWKTTLADEKRALAELPMQMGLGTMGSIGKVGKAQQIASKIGVSKEAEMAAQKLEQAVSKGYKPTAAEAEAVAKFRGTQTVVPTAQEAAAKRAQLAIKEPVKNIFAEPPKSLGALESTSQGLKRNLKITTGSGL